MGNREVAALSGLASHQAGCVSVRQATELGCSLRQMQTLVRSGVLVREHPRVLRFAGVQPGRASRVWAAWLQGGPGSVVSHEAALFVHGVDRVPFRPALIVPPEAHHGVAGIRIHRHCDLSAEHVGEVDGLPVTTLERAVVDVTCRFSRVRLADLVDRLTITERRTTLGGIARAYRAVNRRGRRNIGSLGRVLDERSDGGPRLRSLLERDLDALLATTGLPEPLHEMPVPTLGERLGLVDRAWPEARLIVEVDGRSWHARERSMAADRERDRAAGRAGWFTARVLDEEVRDRPDLVVDDVVDLHRRRVAELRPA